MKQLKVLSFVFLSCTNCIFLQAQSSFDRLLISRVSQKKLQASVHELVKYGNRIGGTKSGDRSVEYIVKKFKSFGYSPEIIREPFRLVYAADSWKLEIQKPKRLRGLIQHEWLAGYSPSALRDTAHLVFIESFRAIDEERVNKGAVLLNRHPSERMYEELVEAGARCILCYQENVAGSYSNWAMISQLKETEKNAIPVFNIPNVAGQRIREELEKHTPIIIKYFSAAVVRNGIPKTVVAELPGKTDEYYIVCAHGDSDSGGPGADDNASGVSSVLEIARILKAMVQTKKLPEPPKGIRFIIWGTENYSANKYVEMHADSLKRISGVINIDEVGIGKSRNCLYFEGNNIAHNQPFLKLFEGIGEEFAGKKGFWKESTTNPLQGGTDSYIFLPENLYRLNVPEEKIPSITIFTSAWNQPKSMRQTRGWLSKAWQGHPDSVIIDYSPYYHSSLDIPAFTTDKEPANMVWASNAVGIALIRLLWK